MFDYTKLVLEKTIKDIKKVAYVSNVGTQIAYLIYLIYALIAGTGFWYVNAVLLALSTAYFAYFLHSSNHESKNKTRDKKMKKLYSRIKQGIKLFPLAVALYSLCLTIEKTNPFTLISTAFMLIGWLLQFIFDVLGTIIGSRIELFKEAIDADVSEITKPVKSVGNFFKKVTGQEVEEEKQPTKNRVWLEEQVVGYRERKAEKKRLQEEDKKLQRREARENLKRKFLSKQAERKLLQSAKRKVGASKTDVETEPEDGEKE